MIRYIALAAVVLAATVVASPAAAQSAPAAPTKPAPAPADSDSLSIAISPELQRSLDELAATLDRLARRIANDPELRASAVRAAQTFVGVAQVMVVQQAELLQEALKNASDKLAEVAPASATQQQRRH